MMLVNSNDRKGNKKGKGFKSSPYCNKCGCVDYNFNNRNKQTKADLKEKGTIK